MDTPIFEYVLKNLAQSKGRWPQVAEGSGVPYKTVTKIAQGETLDPGVNNVQKLADYFRGQVA